MLPDFLVSDTERREEGAGDALDLGDSKGKLVKLTLGITRIIEQESLDISIWGSPDGTNWEARPLIVFPQKFYCGTYTVFLDLPEFPEIRHIRAQWKMARWGRGQSKPLFGFYLFAEETELQVLSKTA